MHKDFDALIDIYGDRLTPLDIHYLSAKCYGVRDERTKSGRPSFNMMDEHDLYHITFGTSEEDSPYTIKDQKVQYLGESLPFQVKMTERCEPDDGRYYYYRHFDYLTPTIDDQLTLNINCIRQCFCCDFCQFVLYKHQPNVTPEEMFEMIKRRGDQKDLSGVDQIAVVTGLLGSGKEALAHTNRIIDLAVGKGFHGSFFYMGFEIGTPELVAQLAQKVHTAGLSGLRLAYTVEMFSERSRLMHGKKAHETVKDIIAHMKTLASVGIDRLEYSYIPGLDPLDDFKRGAELLVPYASPHICIFRPWKSGQRLEQISQDYAKMGPAYLAEARLFYESLYSGPIYGNQLANLWPFPNGRFDPRWRYWNLEGPSEFNQYWAGHLDPRQRCRDGGCGDNCEFFVKNGYCLYDKG